MHAGIEPAFNLHSTCIQPACKRGCECAIDFFVCREQAGTFKELYHFVSWQPTVDLHRLEQLLEFCVCNIQIPNEYKAKNKSIAICVTFQYILLVQDIGF
jgi:hypothetical protein